MNTTMPLMRDTLRWVSVPTSQVLHLMASIVALSS